VGGRASRGEAVDRTPLIKALGVDLDDELLTLALTHRSYAYENGGLPPNERLEFLGDAVLGLVVTDHLYRAHPDLPEGQLAKLRASVVNMQALAGVARSLGDGGLGAHLLLGRGEELTGGRVLGSGVGRTKKAAEQQAAEAAWRAITAEASGDDLGPGDPRSGGPRPGGPGSGGPRANGDGPNQES